MILKPVRIGLIGCGGYALQLIKRILSVPNSGVLVAVVAKDAQEPGVQYCRDRGIRIFDSVKELLDHGGFEVVMNPTPIHLHASITKQCLKAGFPVWLEKPPVATIQDLVDLQAASKEAGMPVAVCFNSLFSSITQNLKKELVAGRFGDVLQIKGIGAWVRTQAYFERNDWAGRLQRDGQWILDGGVNNPFAHVLCNNLYFASPAHHTLAEPVSIEAELYRSHEIESEDTSCLRIKTRDGIEILDYLTLCPGREIPPRTVVSTEKALITFSDFRHLKIEFYDGSIEEHEAYQEDRIEMIEHLCRAFRTGDPYLSTLDMMRPFTMTVNCAFESSGVVHPIPEQYLNLASDNSGGGVSIDGMEKIMEDAFESNSLYSEIGIPWAVKAEKFRLNDYMRFPVRFKDHSCASGLGL